MSNPYEAALFVLLNQGGIYSLNDIQSYFKQNCGDTRSRRHILRLISSLRQDGHIIQYRKSKNGWQMLSSKDVVKLRIKKEIRERKKTGKTITAIFEELTRVNWGTEDNKIYHGYNTIRAYAREN